jgi:Predicted signal-transduction protein containing cAMP-binding and CBS domains
LGKQLYLRVNDLYAINEKPVVAPNASIKDVILEISSKRLGATAVLDADGKLLGIITDGDLRRMLNSHDTFAHLKAADIMTKSPKAIDAEEYAASAMTMMQSKNITQLVVMKENAFVGFIHIHDLLKEGIV